VYDEEKRVKVASLGGEDLQMPGHNSRIYCVKFDKEQPNTLYSGGWDMRVVRWDIREKNPTSLGLFIILDISYKYT